jgi:hypothetical protein
LVDKALLVIRFNYLKSFYSRMIHKNRPHVFFIDRRVSRIINEYNDEIEMEIIMYQDHYKVVVTICQEEPPYNDLIGVGTDKRSVRRAARKALNGLYLQAYPVLFMKKQKGSNQNTVTAFFCEKE